jgi:hypothetical protein
MKNHRLLREVCTMTKMNSPYIVKYTTCWLESLDSIPCLGDDNEKSSESWDDWDESDSHNSNEPRS